MIKSSKVKLKPFKTLEFPLSYEVHEYNVFYELFPHKKHPMYGKGDGSKLGLFSSFEQAKALLLYPDWEERVIYLSFQKNKKTEMQLVNVYLLHKTSIKQVTNQDNNKNIEINSDYIFSDAELGRNKGNLIILNNDEMLFLQSNKETTELIDEQPSNIKIIFNKVDYYKLGDKILLDIPNLKVRETKSFINKIKDNSKKINIFTDESSLYYYVNENNKQRGSSFQDDTLNYKALSATIIKDNTSDLVSIFINKDFSDFKNGLKYQAFIDYKKPIWLIKKEVDFVTFKTEVLFLLESEQNLSEIEEGFIK